MHKIEISAKELREIIVNHIGYETDVECDDWPNATIKFQHNNDDAFVVVTCESAGEC